MPISMPLPLRIIDQDGFAKLDYQVMRHAFASQNGLGRLCDEAIYQIDLALRLEADGIGPIRKEMPVTARHRDFSKTYYLDLVVADAAIYELKTAVCLVPEHDAQLLNYLFLTGVQHGKLINFRAAQVGTKFINNGMSAEVRNRFEIDTRRWLETDGSSRVLRETLVDLLEDWGACLELTLYLDALMHFCGSENRAAQTVPISRDGLALGSQQVCFAGEETAFRLTALTKDTASYEQNLRSFLRHTPLRTIQWINLARQRIEFVTVTR